MPVRRFRTASATAELAARLLGAESLPQEILDRLPESTEGNPLFVRELVRMLAADGVILASPVYFSNVTSQIKALIDRAGMTAIANNAMFRRKLGASVVVARRGGASHTFASLNNFFFISQMIVPGSNYWNMGFGREKGDVEKDEEAQGTMRTLGQNMAWLLKQIQ